MMKCEQINTYKGNRSEIIAQMIKTKRHDELKEEKEKILQKNLTKLQKQLDKYMKLKKQKREVELVLDDMEREFCAYKDWDYDRNCWKPYRISDYFVSNALNEDKSLCRINKQLQRASDLWVLGKKKQAQQIWDTLIEKFGLI